MRTAPLVTAPRYQEDYLLASQQLKAMDKVNASQRKRLLAISAVVAIGAIVVSAAYLRMRQTSK